MVKKRGHPFSTHKDRTTWFAERTCWPLRDAHPAALEDVWSKWTAPQADAPRWECAGPFNVAGRVTALAVDPRNHDIVHAGSAAGGLWRTRDGGLSWETNWPKPFSPHIGAVAIDPYQPDTIYCATGEANLSADSYAGSGIYISRDAGDTWKLLISARDSAIPRRIGTIGVHPYRGGGKILYLGGVTHDETIPSGLYASKDGGETWAAEQFFSSQSYWCHSIVFHPDGFIFATINTRGAENGIWRLGVEGWERLETGLPSGDQIGRVTLAMAPSHPAILYALVADWRGKKLQGVFRTRNRGERWEKLTTDSFESEHEMSYTNTIAVHPQNPDVALWGGIDLYVTRDGGKNWSKSSQWDADPATAVFVHADQHALAMPGGDRIYAGNDGGVAVSEDAGRTWSTRSRGMVTTMFYDMDAAPTNSGVFGGGAQDNGTLLTGIGDAPGEFHQVLPGDGGWMVFDPRDDTNVFGSAQNIRIYRHAPNSRWDADCWKPIHPEGLTTEEEGQTAIAVMVINPSCEAALKTVWVGSKRLWRTTNSGGNWRPVSPVLDGSVITAIEIAAENPEVILVGTTNGSIFRSRDGGDSWSGDLSGPEIPRRLISQIRTHPRAAERIVVTVGGTGMVARLVPRHGYHGPAPRNELAPFSHVFYSVNGGVNWRPIDGRDMPDVAYHAAAFETRDPYRLFVGNDCGVWMTQDMRHWEDLSATLPNVMVTSLVYHHDDRILMAATYGRGIWHLRMPVKSPFGARSQR